MGRKRGLTAFLCVVLAAVLVVFMFDSRSAKREESEQLKAASVTAEAESIEGTEESASGAVQTTEPGSGIEESGAGTAGGEGTESEAMSTGTEAGTLTGVSLRGESFTTEEGAIATSYAAYIAQDLQAAGLANVNVEDYTVTKSGSMSHLKKAGVDQATLDQFVASHQAAGLTTPITETKIRDFSAEELARDDQNALPVVCIGYYGGWGDSNDELVQQVQLLLGTYSQQNQYIVLGYYPTSYGGGADYDAKMQAAFGDHYISLNAASLTGMNAATRQGIAQAVVDKMQELGYTAALTA